MTPRSPKANAVLVQALGSGIRSTGNGLADLPALLRRVMEEEAWREFINPMGKLIEHSRFVDFVVTPPTAGLGASVDLLKRIVANDPVAADLLDQALAGRPGERTDLVDNINEVSKPDGTSKEAGLRRLRKDRPDLHAEVLAGNLSTHAAMVKAGFRRKLVSVPVDKPENTAKAIRRNMDPEAVAQLAKLLTEEA